MGFADDDHRRLFFALHDGLPRQGPGTEGDTLRALKMTGLSGPLEVLDLGSGPGAQSMVLLEALPEALVTAIDTHAPFLAEATARAADLGYAGRFTAVEADMADPPVSPGTVDLLWCEAAIYTLGIAEALALWRPLLSPRGVLVFSDAVWFTPTPPAPVAAFWAEYPGMTDVYRVQARVRGAGYAMMGGFLLREAAWDAYYGPLAARERALRAEIGDHPVLAAAREEMAIRTEFPTCYGYAMFVVRPRADGPGA